MSQAWGEAASGDYVNIPPVAEHVDFRLVPTATVSGIVTDEQGSPVPDIEVSAIRHDIISAPRWHRRRRNPQRRMVLGATVSTN